MNYKVVLVISLFAIITQTCTGVENGTTNTDGQTSDGSINTEKTPLEKGMEPIFKMCHQFLDVVMPSNFYSDSDTDFNAHEIARIVNEQDYGNIQSRWQEIIKTFGGLGGCVIVGFIFVVFMPIVGLIYCCCHCCCHKCGGTKEMMDPKHAVCKRWTLTILLLICTTMMLAGAIIVFLGSDLLHQSLQNKDNKGLVGKMNEGLTEFQSFINDSLASIDETVSNTLIKQGLDQILPAVETAANRTVDKIKDSINATQLLTEANDLGDAAVEIAGNLAQLGPVLTSLRALQTNASDVLNNVKTDIDNACSPSLCGTLDTSGLVFNPDFTALDELTAQTNQIQSAQEIQKFVKQASDSFNTVYNEVDTTVQTEITNARGEITTINDTINTNVASLKGKATPMNDGIANVHNDVKDIDSQLQDAAKYIWYSCVGIGCLVLLVVFFYYMGVLYGLCGERPGHRAGCCNRETGGGLLCTGICCTFLFAWLLMLIVTMLFLVGGLTYSLGCKYTNDGIENIGDMESLLNDLNVNISNSLGFSGDSNLTVAGMLSNCKKNEGIYTALELNNLFDIDKYFDVSDVLKQVDAMVGQISTITSVGNITLLPNDLVTQLNNFKASSIANVNFTEYKVELEKQLIAGDLTAVINELYSASNDLKNGNPTQQQKAQQLNNSASELVTLRDVTIPAIQSDVNNLSTVVNNLQTKAQDTVTTKIDELKVNIQTSQDFFNTQSIKITQEELNKTVDAIKVLIIDLVDDAKSQIKNNVGKCRSLYDSIQAAVDSVCIVTLDPLNTIWFGLGWSLFFYIPSFIFATMLMSLYKRSEKYRQKQNFDDPIRSHHEDNYNNGYRGGRHDDNVPLTSMGKDQRPNSNGAYNYGYQGRDSDPRYHRDSYPNNTPDRHSYDRGAPISYDRGVHGGAPRGSQHYAEPYEHPPLYDDAISPRYDRVGHGGYPSGRHY